MAKEIERKFLVAGPLDFLADSVREDKICQGYLFSGAHGVARVRIRGGKGFLTVKSANRGLERNEWEYEIPLDDARGMMEMCRGKVIEKTRYLVPFGGRIWEVDIFSGKLAGLRLAEVEIESTDSEITLPPWVGEEVSHDPRYFNSSLASLESI